MHKCSLFTTKLVKKNAPYFAANASVLTTTLHFFEQEFDLWLSVNETLLKSIFSSHLGLDSHVLITNRRRGSVVSLQISVCMFIGAKSAMCVCLCVRVRVCVCVCVRVCLFIVCEFIGE